MSRRRAQRELSAAREAVETEEAQRAKVDRRIEEIDREIAALERRDTSAETLRALVRSRLDDEVRADAVFGELMDAELADTLHDAIEAVQQSVEADTGRAGAIDSTRAEELIEATIRSVEFVPDVDSAEQVAQEGRTAVTPDGIVVRPDGVVLAGGITARGETAQATVVGTQIRARGPSSAAAGVGRIDPYAPGVGCLGHGGYTGFSTSKHQPRPILTSARSLRDRPARASGGTDSEKFRRGGSGETACSARPSPSEGTSKCARLALAAGD